MNQYVNFFPRQLPALSNGTYEVRVQQSSNITDCYIKDAAFQFVVDSEQVKLNPALVYSVYPPEHSAAAYANCLPHIVLNRKTIPWERHLYENDPKIPWVCLLVFSQEEGVTLHGDTYAGATKGPAQVFTPNLGKSRIGADDEPCQYIDIPYPLFQAVLPRRDELALLTHVRLVALDDKVTDAEVKNGWFSCVVANRYPQQVQDRNNSIRHTAHLVSLEGFQKYLDAPEHASVNDKDMVRMFALASWDFICQAEDLDFYGNAEKLNVDVFSAKMETNDPTLDQMTSLGYLPMNHSLREGSQSLCWYRPPLCPGQPAQQPQAQCNFGDKLLRYDPALGMFDITYQAAWQLGRLMALEDTQFSRTLIAWRLQVKQAMAQRQTNEAILLALGIDAADINIPGGMDAAHKASWMKLAQQLIALCGAPKEGDEGNA